MTCRGSRSSRRGIAKWKRILCTKKRARRKAFLQAPSLLEYRLGEDDGQREQHKAMLKELPAGKA
jgi:hypothetical protein